MNWRLVYFSHPPVKVEFNGACPVSPQIVKCRVTCSIGDFFWVSSSSVNHFRAQSTEADIGLRFHSSWSEDTYTDADNGLVVGDVFTLLDCIRKK
ncbi:hypothetical protein PoB_006831000 [Plakobranchus ocellatus]|uniref:MATH domain-containing protein n=1 Tax=Plakobranchus ocellatus TaxID=259542 RepID=A0AAV4DCY4_9GAST|nr:hypothetical protein PoB_006831000 [Plakobranchus ocellatus]